MPDVVAPVLPVPADVQAQDLGHGAAHTTSEPEFVRDISVSLVAEFRRLAILNGWKKKSKGYRQERRHAFTEWAVEDFEREFGRNSNNLKAWQKLLRLLGVGENLHFGSITECKGALHGVYVNIVDLVDACKTLDEKPRIFESSQALAKYIRRTGKYFPIDMARASSLLSTFLIRVNKGTGGGGDSKGRRRRRKAKAEAKAKAAAEEKAVEEAAGEKAVAEANATDEAKAVPKGKRA